VGSSTAAPSVGLYAEVPTVLATLIDDCLRKEPEARPTAAQVAASLRNTLSLRRASLNETESPFRGLLPFTERQADLFFGRDPEVAALLERLRLQPLLAVVGPSGAGKSSFIQAGVVPRLREQAPWVVVRVRPGIHPFLSLASHLLRRDGMTSPGLARSTGLQDSGTSGSGSSRATPDRERELAAELESQPNRLALELRSMAEERGAQVLLLVDQLEELCTLAEDSKCQDAFMRTVCTAADDPTDPVRVIVCLRDDYLGRLATSAETREALTHVMVIQNLEAEALRAILTRSLDAVGYKVEDPELVEQMVASVRGEPAGLPLLQFAAQALWQQRDRERRLLLRATYERMGGVGGALAQHADGILKGLSPKALHLVRQLLLRLVTPERTRRVVSRKQLLDGLDAGSADDANEMSDAQDVLARLVDSRLLTISARSTRRAKGPATDADAMLELAHDSLVKTWPTLSQWLLENEEEHIFLAEVGQTAELWDKRGRSAQELWQGETLADPLRAAKRCAGELPTRVRQFLAAGRARAVRKRRIRTVLVGATTVALAALTLVLATLWQAEQEQRGRAEAKEAEAQRQRAATLREAAAAALEQGEWIEARARLREALQEHDERSTTARALWWQVEREPTIWRKELGCAAYGVAFSPDGSKLAAACQDGTVQVLDRETRQADVVLRGHDDQVLAVAYSPDGATLATGTWGGDVHLWEAQSGKQLRKLEGHDSGVNRVVFSSDGTRLVSASHDTTVRIWSVETGTLERVLKGHRGCVPGVAFSPDGNQLVTASRDKTIRLWNWRSGAIERVLEGHDDALSGVAFSPDGQQLASASVDKTVRLWSVKTGDLERVLEGHDFEVSGVVYSPDGQRIASVSIDKTIRLWNAKNGTVQRVLTGHGDAIYGVAYSPDGTTLATASTDKTVRLWDTRVAGSHQELGGHRAGVNRAAFSPDGQQLATASDDKTVRLWHVRSGKADRVLEGHDGNVSAVAFSPNGEQLASASNDKTVRLWHGHTGALEHVLEGHDDVLRDVVFGPQGHQIASAGRDKTIRLWEARTGTLQRVLLGHEDVVHGVAFSPGGGRLASASYDKTVRLWDLNTGVVLQVLEGHDDTVRSVAFSPDGSQLASASDDRTVRMWDVDASGTGDSRELGRHQARFYSAAFAPDGKRLGAALDDGTACIWTFEAGTHQELRGHRAEVNSLAFSPNGKLAATTSDDRTVRLWNVNTGHPHWHAPALVGSPPRLLSHRGWEQLAPPGDQATELHPEGARSPVGTKLDDTLRQGARLARQPSVPKEPGGVWQLCVQTFDDELELWNPTDDRPVTSQAIKGLAQIVAWPGGCAGRGEDGVQVVGSHGQATKVAFEGRATAVGEGHGHLLIATAKDVFRVDYRGKQVARYDGSPGIRVLGWQPVEDANGQRDWLIIGFQNGNIELRPVPAVGTPPAAVLPLATAEPSAALVASSTRRWLELTPSSEPVRMLAGPMGTLVVGYANGEVGLWNLADGARLAHHHLHGPVVHLVLDDHKLYAATELSSSLVWNFDAFYLAHCELLRQVWTRVPVLWRSGQAVRAPVPTSHRCWSPD